jgi:hypothetical protein
MTTRSATSLPSRPCSVTLRHVSGTVIGVGLAGNIATAERPMPGQRQPAWCCEVLNSASSREKMLHRRHSLAAMASLCCRNASHSVAAKTAVVEMDQAERSAQGVGRNAHPCWSFSGVFCSSRCPRSLLTSNPGSNLIGHADVEVTTGDVKNL